MTNGERDSDDTTGTPGPRADTDPRTEADAGLTGGEGTPADEYEEAADDEQGDDE